MRRKREEDDILKHKKSIHNLM